MVKQTQPSDLTPVISQVDDEIISNEPTNSTSNLHSDDVVYDGSVFCNPSHRVHRFLVLIFICFLSFGSYFCYDNPSALQDVMLRDLNIDKSTFMGFYAWYSWPNVVLSFIGGFLIDKVFGIRLGAFIFGSFVLAGQILFGIGALMNSVAFMTFARFVFGVGGENLAVAQNTYTVAWFKDKELNLVFGIALSFSRFGSTLNGLVMEPLYEFTGKTFNTVGYKTLGWTLLLAALMCLLSVLTSLVMAFFDRRASRILRKEAAQSGEVIKFRDIKDFPLTFWLLCLICVTYYVAVFPFVSIAQIFFENKYNFDPELANTVNSLVYFVSLGASPLAGLGIDFCGKNVFWVLAGVLISIASHAVLVFTFISPFVGTCALGIGYSLVASALWPMVALVIPEYQLGTAYGIMQCIQNLGLAVVAYVIGAIVDDHGYLILEVFLLLCLFAALLITVILYLFDAAKRGILNMNPKMRIACLKKLTTGEKST